MSTNANPTPVRVFYAPGAAAYCGISREELYKRLKRGDFPKPFRYDPPSSLPKWDIRDLDAWIDAKKAADTTGAYDLVDQDEAREVARQVLRRGG